MDSTVSYTMMESPVGEIRLAWSEQGLLSISLGSELASSPPDPSWRYGADLKCAATDQLRAYFNGELRHFDLPLVLNGTPFQRRAWLALADIPFGETVSYAEQAKRIGVPKAVRAVGAANGKNPIPIVLPCHRVIGSNGRLTGYAGGLELKAALLDFERGVVQLPFAPANAAQ
jgi:methylated-DNA-[protein]-cysteine S-methyltransferase